MTSGHKTLREIERSIDDLRQRERGLMAELEESNREQAELLDQRTVAFRELAEVRVSDALADGVIDQADQLHHRISGILRARQKTINDFKGREEVGLKQRASLVSTADELRADLEKLDKKLDRAAEHARQELASDKKFAGLKARADRARKVFDQADIKTKRAELDRKNKGKAYETDPLFMYLWERKYGSSDYTAHALIEIADGWVAKLVGYYDARANYTMLNEIPERLRAHCHRLNIEADALEDEVQVVEAQRIKQAAGNDLINALADVRERQALTIDTLERVDAELKEISVQLAQYAEGMDPSFQEAVALSASFLEQQKLEHLLNVARMTVEPTDDEIVGRIERIERKAGKLKRDISKKREMLDKLSGRRDELVKVAARFRRRHYDDPGSEFESNDFANELLQELIRGAINGLEYWDRGQRRHRWARRSADPYRRDAGFPPFGRGGGSRGRDFRTGGGF